YYEMTTTHFEIQPLTSQDRAKLRKQYLFAGVFLLFASAIFSFIYFFVLQAAHFSVIPIVVVSIFLLVFAGVFSYMLWNTYIDLKQGIKHCYTGIVNDKRIDTHSTKSRSYNSRVGTNTRHRSSRRYYYVSIDSIEHSVPYSDYAKANLNDKVYLESSPKNKEVFVFTVLEKSQNPVGITNNTKLSVPFNTTSVSKPMSSKEIDLVKTMFYKKVRRALIFIAIYGILVLTLWQGIFIFLIPVLVVFVYASIKLLIQINNYAKFKRNGTLKQIITVKVTDKLTLSSNTNTTKFRLVTNVENIDVSESIYKQIQANDSIKLHRATFLKYLVGVSFEEGTNYMQNV
ncbi:MAG: hypothetical protein KDD05_09445, partial [Psychroserpens sp.]|nr:hypothetical protein [Psychroserpens sp.]